MITDGEGTTEEVVETTTEEASGNATGTPPVTPPVDDSKDKLLQVYESGLQEARARADNLERELRSLQQQRQPSVKDEPVVPMDNNEFWANSAQNIAKLINTALDERIKPLVDFVNETKGGNQYSAIKDKLRNDPRLKDKFTEAEPYIDQLMRTTEVTEQNVMTATLSVIGGIASGMIKTSGVGAPPPTPPNPTTTTNDRQMMPAHLRPSGPTTQQPKQEKKGRDLTELEKRIARENRMTDVEYLAELEDTDKPMIISNIMPKAKKPADTK